MNALLIKFYSISHVKLKFESNVLAMFDKSNWSINLSKESTFIWLISSTVNWVSSFFMIFTQFANLSLSTIWSFLKIFEQKDFQYFSLLLIYHFLINWVPIIFNSWFFIVLLTRNAKSKSGSLFSNFRGFWFESFLF